MTKGAQNATLRNIKPLVVHSEIHAVHCEKGGHGINGLAAAGGGTLPPSNDHITGSASLLCQPLDSNAQVINRVFQFQQCDVGLQADFQLRSGFEQVFRSKGSLLRTVIGLDVRPLEPYHVESQVRVFARVCRMRPQPFLQSRTQIPHREGL